MDYLFSSGALLASSAEYLLSFAKSIFATLKLGVIYAVSTESAEFGVNTGIEGMRSHQFSVGIFYFLLASIIVFTIFVFMFMFKGRGSKLKTGEKVMFAWILFGVVAAVIFGAAQMLHGYLF